MLLHKFRAETNIRNVTKEPFSKRRNIRTFVRLDNQALNQNQNSKNSGNSFGECYNSLIIVTKFIKNKLVIYSDSLVRNL